MKKYLAACVLGLGLLSAPAQSPAAVSGSTTYDVSFNGFLILNYYDELHLQVNAVEKAVTQGSAGTWTMNWADGTATGGTSLTTATLSDPTTGAIPTSVTVTVPNVWAIRGLTNSGNAKVSIVFGASSTSTATTQDLIKGTTGSKVTASELKVSQGSIAAASSITVPVAGIAASQAKIGNVQMKLDLTNLTQSGLHTGGQYTITAEAI